MEGQSIPGLTQRGIRMNDDNDDNGSLMSLYLAVRDSDGVDALAPLT